MEAASLAQNVEQLWLSKAPAGVKSAAFVAQDIASGIG